MQSLAWGNEFGIFKNLFKIVNGRHKITPSCICVTNNKNIDVFPLKILATLTQKKEQWKYTNLNLGMTFLDVSFCRLFNFICEDLHHEQ